MSENTPQTTTESKPAWLRRTLKSVTEAQKGCSARTLTETDITHACTAASAWCDNHGVLKKERVGLRFSYDRWTQPYKKWGIQGTVLTLTGTAGGWAVEASREYCGQNGRLLTLLTNATSHRVGMAVAARVFGCTPGWEQRDALCVSLKPENN